LRARELWRVPEEFLEEAQDDATRLAVAEMERAGVDIVTDGEMRRESYSNRFATALEGVDLDTPGVALDRTGHPNPVPRVVGAIRRTRPVETRDVAFLRSLTTRCVKITVPGPFTMAQQAQDDHYGDARELALAYAEAVNGELRDLKAAGADVVQIDERACRPGPRRRARTQSRPSTGHSRGSTATRFCTRASGTRVVHDWPEGYPFLAELNGVPGDAPVARSGTAGARPGSAAGPATRSSSSACSTSQPPRQRRPRSSLAASATRSV
jgi:5-methyltetrahydropteroyltriglutamate--homocysteine methyltransferase